MGIRGGPGLGIRTELGLRCCLPSASEVDAQIFRCFNPGDRRAAAKKRTPWGGAFLGARVQRSLYAAPIVDFD